MTKYCSTFLYHVHYIYIPRYFYTTASIHPYLQEKAYLLEQLRRSEADREEGKLVLDETQSALLHVKDKLSECTHRAEKVRKTGDYML